MPPRPLASYQHPITGNQALLKADLTLMSPKLDEPHTQTAPVTLPHTHTQSHTQNTVCNIAAEIKAT